VAIMSKWRIAFYARAWHVPALGLGLSFRKNSLPMAVIMAVIRIGSKPPVRYLSVERTSHFVGGETRLFKLPVRDTKHAKADNRYDCGELRSQGERSPTDQFLCDLRRQLA
jgi:hypothetical protein